MAVEYSNSNSPTLQNSTYSPSLQPSTPSQDGSNYPINPSQDTQYINDPNNPGVVYALGPDGNPDPKNPVVYTVDENGNPVMGVPAMNYDNNPPVMMAPPPPPPAQGFRMTKEIAIAIFAIIIVIVGGIMLGVSRSSYESCVENCIINNDNAVTDYSYSYSYSYYDYDLQCYKGKCKSTYEAVKGTGIALLVIGAILLLGDGAFAYNIMQQEMNQQQQNQMQQMQMQM